MIADMVSTSELPPGLTLLEDFLPPELAHDLERQVLMAFQDHPDDIKQPIPRAKGKRLSLHYGQRFDYSTFGVSIEQIPVPVWLEPLLEHIRTIRVNNQVSCTDPQSVQNVLPFDFEPNQITIQHYPPGVGIPPHVDTHSTLGSHILSYSLTSTVNMQFKKANANTKRKMFAPKRCLNGNAQTSSQGSTDEPEGAHDTVEMPLKANSLAVMADEVRHAWTHGIRSRKTDMVDGVLVARQDRYSITLRQTDTERVCNCAYIDWCDSQQRGTAEGNTGPDLDVQ